MQAERPDTTRSAHAETRGSPDNENLRRTLRLTREMLALADEGERDHLDSSCAILYVRLRDIAYTLRRTVEEECERHRRAGRWD